MTTMVRIVKRHWPIISALFVLLVMIFILLFISLEKNDGHLVYALDDPYIHMAIAKNLAEHGVWGTTRYHFGSAASSLLWILLLTFSYLIFGINQVSPLIFNIFFAVLLVGYMYHILRSFGVTNAYNLFVLLAMILLTPLPALIFVGMEHTLHTLVTIIFAMQSLRCLLKPEKRSAIPLFILGPLMVMSRFEGLSLVLIVCILLLIKRDFRTAFTLGLISLLPVGIYGIISVMQGGYFLPNSVLLKAKYNDIDFSSIRNIAAAPFASINVYYLYNRYLFSLVIVSLVILLSELKKSLWNMSIILNIFFVFPFILHTQLSRLGSFYRYDAYLVALGTVVIALTSYKYLVQEGRLIKEKRQIPRYITLVLLMSLLSPYLLPPFLYSCYDRMIKSTINIPKAMKNIYEQQYQMGLFLSKFYPGARVAANDIGAINYLADIRSLNLWGQDEVAVLKAKMNHHYDVKTINELSAERDIVIAIVYDHWFEPYGGLPPSWIKVGQWKIMDNWVCGGDTVSFYAIKPEVEHDLSRKLREFSPQLPRGVIQSGKYLNP